MKSSSLKVIDVFSGCGGLSLGFQNSGFEIVAAFENWKSAINVYKRMF
jgi:DNA (cytosine-5)-methyltransferase 1